ncbi:MAG: efflux RND transporter periplasmic adaptor subunit [Bacteroidales bacterium]|jgi:membrane fusion protein (multidrug efflux system)|nr:efflux RND transporter periplasmic adaptor subunit [Bacteroidales bacterium]
MKKRTWIILGIIVVVFVLGMVFFPKIKTFIFGKSEETLQQMVSGKRPPLNVNTTILQFQTLKDEFYTKGVILPDEEVDLAFETSGKIIKIYFQEGSAVTKGQLLAKVNDNQLQAELKKLEAQINLFTDRVYRQKSLLDKDAVSKETYESVVTDLNKLNADIELVKAKIDLTELRAPFTGIIGLRFVSEGAYASPNLVIARLTKVSPIKIEFSVNEKQTSDLKNGTAISFNVDGDTNTYKANVYAIESKLDEKTLSLKARAIYANSNGKLKPGFSTNIKILQSEIKNALVVPSMAVVAEMGKDYVFIYENSKAKQIFVKKGLRTASSVQILDGLKENDTLITSGVMQLRDGIDVVLNIQ